MDYKELVERLRYIRGIGDEAADAAMKGGA